MPFPNITFNTLINCVKKEFISEKSFGWSPKQIYNGNFRKHSRAALDKMKLYQMGNKTKNLDLAWIYCKWRKLHKPLLDPPPHTPPQWSCDKTRQVSRNQGHKQLAKHEIWMVDLLWWPIKVINMFETYPSEIRKKLFAKENGKLKPNWNYRKSEKNLFWKQNGKLKPQLF